MKKTTKGILASALLGASLVLGACELRTGSIGAPSVPMCGNVTATNVIEAGKLVEMVDTYLDLTTSSGLTKELLLEGNEILMEAIDFPQLEVITEGDQEFKNEYLTYRGHIMDIVYKGERYLDYKYPEDLQEMQDAIVALAGFTTTYNQTKDMCSK